MASEEIVKSALYGDLKYAFQPNNFKDGKLILEGNGAWNPEKNRSTSALMYIPNRGEPLIIHNYWAYNCLTRCMFSCKEVVPLDDGTFKEIDCP